jgi:Ca2+-binding RTX toxin-like protein
MTGGTGDDIYIVDSASDTIVENSGEGTDTILADTSYTLSANVENLTLSGNGVVNGTGNALDNIIIGTTGNGTLTGGGGNDTLDGNGGEDTMIGGTGNDTYIVDSKNDLVTENAAEGTDTVHASLNYTLGTNFENLTLTGTSGINGTGNSVANVLTGNSAGNNLSGGAGNDTIFGGDGNDSLTGGTGADQFDFNAISEIGDTITDFEVGASGDMIDLIDILLSVGYSGSDPLGDARVRTQSTGPGGNDTDIEIDTTGSGDYAVIVTLDGISQGDITVDNWIFS